MAVPDRQGIRSRHGDRESPGVGQNTRQRPTAQNLAGEAMAEECGAPDPTA